MPAEPLAATHAARLRRVVDNVLGRQHAGALPRLAWHDGLRPSERRELQTRWPLPVAAWDALDVPCPFVSDAEADAGDLLYALRELLSTHRAHDDPALRVLANALASGCFGHHHLWQDLGLGGRDEVSRLLEAGFPHLHARNVRNLRWKRHLFAVLGDRLGRADLRPPKCDRCGDFEICFGPPGAAGPPTWPVTPVD